MGSKGSSDYRARQRDRERRRHQRRDGSIARQRKAARAVRVGGPRPRRAGGATGRSPRGHGDRSRNGARRPAGTGPGSSPAPPHPDEALSTSSNGWSPSRPGGRRQRRSPGRSAGSMFFGSSPPRWTRARCMTGTCSPSPRPSTKSSAPFTGAAARPNVQDRRGRGGDNGVTWGATTLRASLRRCHPGPAVSNRPGSAPSDGDGHPSVPRRRHRGRVHDHWRRPWTPSCRPQLQRSPAIGTARRSHPPSHRGSAPFDGRAARPVSSAAPRKPRLI